MLHRFTNLLLGIGVLAGTAAAQGPGSRLPDLVVPAGRLVVYDTTTSGPLLVGNLVLEPGSTLRVQGSRPFLVLAVRSIAIEGTLDLSGFDARRVATLNTGYIPESGGAGVAGGGSGGTGSWVVDGSTPAGGDGTARTPGGGGRGGESGASLPRDRGASVRATAAVARWPRTSPWSRIVRTRRRTWAFGRRAAATAPTPRAAHSPAPSPRRGAPPRAPVFTDADPGNDFWGLKVDPAAQRLIRGELGRPVPGSGGGAGGDALASRAFPTPNWNFSSDEKGEPVAAEEAGSAC